jgi:hypothetical protein
MRLIRLARLPFDAGAVPERGLVHRVGAPGGTHPG